jgi:hypothetical protein
MAWTEITRAKYRREGLRYASDTTDACREREICPPYVAHEMSGTFVACSGGCGCVEHECYGRFM